MCCSHTDTILLFGLSAEERQVVDTANRYVHHAYFEAECMTDLLAVPHVALVADPTRLSEADWVALMEYYRQVPEDGANAFFTRPMLVPNDVTAAFHFPAGVKDLQWQLTGHLYHHAHSNESPRDIGKMLRQALRDYSQKYRFIFFLCSPKNIALLTDLQFVAKEVGRPFVCSDQQSFLYRRNRLNEATRQMMLASLQSGEEAYHFEFDLDPILSWREDLIPLMEGKGFYMSLQVDRDPVPILKRFNSEDSLLLYSMAWAHLALADCIAPWWKGESAWDTFTIEKQTPSRKEILI